MACCSRTLPASRNYYEKNTRLRYIPYIAGTPAVLCGTQPSQAIILAKSSASDAMAAPAPDMWSDCHASVSRALKTPYALCGFHLSICACTAYSNAISALTTYH